ncbi:MAG TPA: EthD domain-containing protein [Acetobacteraceae bacterium]|nr:EthD domain-containing protein [Acetobacteraceae bacterium]
MTIAAISLMRRRDDVPLNAFRHWLDIHGPLVGQFPDLRHYVQCHVIGSPATNATAQALRIDGFPILLFDHDDDRARAHASAAMAACNEDAKLFIGAVARIMATQEDIVPPVDHAGRMRLIVLYPDGANETAVAQDLDRLGTVPRLRGLRRYRVLQQGRARASVIPHLPVNAAAVAQVWFESLVDLECAAAGTVPSGVAQFATEAHRLA